MKNDLRHQQSVRIERDSCFSPVDRLPAWLSNRRCVSNHGSIVSTAVFVIAIIYSSFHIVPETVSAESLQGHTGTALCAPSPTSEARCFALALQQLNEGSNITSVTFNMSNSDPCVKQGITYHAVWVFLTDQYQNGTFVEIDYALHRATDNGPLEKDIVTCCFHCPGIASGMECEPHNINLDTGGDSAGWATIAYHPSSHRYSWYFKGKTIREIEDSSLGYPRIIGVGGETNNWQNDMGVFAFTRIRLFASSNSTWSDYSPNFVGSKVANGKSHVEDGVYSGRYIVNFARFTGISSTRPAIQVFSDHHRTHAQDACGNTP